MTHCVGRRKRAAEVLEHLLEHRDDLDEQERHDTDGHDEDRMG